jgi:hypothetical protein
MEVANFKQGAKFSDHMSAPTEKRSEFSKTKTMKQVRPWDFPKSRHTI